VSGQLTLDTAADSNLVSTLSGLCFILLSLFSSLRVAEPPNAGRPPPEMYGVMAVFSHTIIYTLILLDV